MSTFSNWIQPGRNVWVWDSDKGCAKQCLVDSIDKYGFADLSFHDVPCGRWIKERCHLTREMAERNKEQYDRLCQSKFGKCEPLSED